MRTESRWGCLALDGFDDGSVHKNTKAHPFLSPIIFDKNDQEIIIYIQGPIHLENIGKVKVGRSNFCFGAFLTFLSSLLALALQLQQKLFVEFELNGCKRRVCFGG
jgi:hypothetical protein